MEGWKLRERNQRHKNAGVESAKNGNNGIVLKGVGNARHELSEKSDYGRKPLVANYKYFATH